MTITNGGPPVTAERIVLEVRPLRTGKLSFPSLTLSADGHTASTAPLPIDVVVGHQAGPARAANDPFAGFGLGGGNFDPFGGDDELRDLERRMQSELAPSVAKDDVLVRATVDNPHPYVGQQTTLSIHLLTRVPVGAIQISRLPSVVGATAEDLPSPRQPSPSPVTLHGQRYQSVLIAKKALFPARAGALEIPPVEVAVDAGGGWGPSTRLMPTTAPLHLTARALPPGGRADEAVGRFTLAASSAPNHVVAGEPLTIRVVAQGVGNLHALALPAPEAPPGWRTYPPTVRDAPSATGGRIGGTRTVETVVVPDRAGRFVVERATARLLQSRQRPPPDGARRSAGGERRPRAARRCRRRHGAPGRAARRAAADGALLATEARLRVPRLGRRRRPSRVCRRARRRLAPPQSSPSAVKARAATPSPPAPRARRRPTRARPRRPVLRRARPRAARRHQRRRAAPLPTAPPRLEDRLAAAGVPADVRAAVAAAVDDCDRVRFAPGTIDGEAMGEAWRHADAALAALARSPAARPGASSSLAGATRHP